MKLYDQALHDIWSGVLADPNVPAHSIIMEAMERARALGVQPQKWTLDGYLFAAVMLLVLLCHPIFKIFHI